MGSKQIDRLEKRLAAMETLSNELQEEIERRTREEESPGKIGNTSTALANSQDVAG